MKINKCKKASQIIGKPVFIVRNYTALSTFPERKQRVHTCNFLGVPLTIALTLLILGFHVRLERLCEWLTLIPKVTLFPHTSHFAIIYDTSLRLLTQYKYYIKQISILQELF